MKQMTGHNDDDRRLRLVVGIFAAVELLGLVIVYWFLRH